MKGRITELQASGFSRKLRSKQLRRRRNHLSPILYNLTKQTVRSSSIPLAFSPNSGCCDEVSCNSTRDSVIQAENEEFRRVTRSYSKLREEETAKWIKGVEMEVSESSCVESCSVIEAESKLQSKAGEVTDSSVQIAVRSVEDCDRIFKSNAGKLTENIAISETFGEDCEAQLSDITGSCSNVNLSILNPASTIGKNTRSMRVDLDLACPEHLSDDDEDVQDVSSTTFSELQSEILVSNSELDFSEEYTPSLWLGTGSQFSENSIGDSTPSYSFSLFKQYKQELSMISSRRDNEVSWRVEDEYSDEVTFWRFEDEEDEESYRRLRSRERKKALKLNDYAVEADSKTEYGTLIIEQRLLMVNWIVEMSHTKKLHNETMFLGVHLLDRFLGKAFFKNRRNIELVGISCLTLATRIEENQPFNNVLQKTFNVESNLYSRSEVVAMEWLVQELLDFQCLLPTMYNFLGFYLKAAIADEEMERKTKYLAELALRDHRQLRFWPSTVAAGLAILVSLAANRDLSCQHVMETHIRTKVDDLPECIKSLEWLVKYAC